MAKQIEFYDLDKEYPVSYEFWKDTVAFFLYLGYKCFYWERSFEKQSYQVVRKSYSEAIEKIQNGVVLQDYEMAKDRLYNNYSSFRYYFERAEKMSSLNFKQKIDWTIEQVNKNLQPRISFKNRLYIESDFYKNCYEVLYCKMIIHYFAINHLRIEPNKLIFDPLLLNDSYTENRIDEMKTEEGIIEINNESYLFSYEQRFSYSKELRSVFIDKKLFENIDFSELKNHNIIFKNDSETCELNKRAISDFLILISYFEKINLIKLCYGKDYQKVVIKILNETLGKTVNNSRISRIYNKIVHNVGDYVLSSNDEETLFQVKIFTNKYMSK